MGPWTTCARLEIHNGAVLAQAESILPLRTSKSQGDRISTCWCFPRLLNPREILRGCKACRNRIIAVKTETLTGMYTFLTPLIQKSFSDCQITGCVSSAQTRDEELWVMNEAESLIQGAHEPVVEKHT